VLHHGLLEDMARTGVPYGAPSKQSLQHTLLQALTPASRHNAEQALSHVQEQHAHKYEVAVAQPVRGEYLLQARAACAAAACSAIHCRPLLVTAATHGRKCGCGNQVANRNRRASQPHTSARHLAQYCHQQLLLHQRCNPSCCTRVHRKPSPCKLAADPPFNTAAAAVWSPAFR
jgi:hypothetical protein